MSCRIFFLLCLLGYFELQVCLASADNQLKIKILEETPTNSYDLNQFLNARNQRSGASGSKNSFLNSYNGVNGQGDGGLVAKYKPAPLNGPYHIINELAGKCFEHSENNYKWVICPFDNVTQYEQNIRWRPYQGVLGVWYEWKIVDQKFDSMLMSNGDSCGNELGYRQTTLKFKCNQVSSKTSIATVSEPNMCSYEAVIDTPLVCENKTAPGSQSNIPLSNMMYVYPYLNATLKYEWDAIYGQYKQGLLTEKMYNLSQELIFQKAGFKRRQSDLKTILAKEEEKQEEPEDDKEAQPVAKQPETDLAARLEKCEKENQELKDLLKKHGITYPEATSSPTVVTNPPASTVSPS